VSILFGIKLYDALPKLVVNGFRTLLHVFNKYLDLFQLFLTTLQPLNPKTKVIILWEIFKYFEKLLDILVNLKGSFNNLVHTLSLVILQSIDMINILINYFVQKQYYFLNIYINILTNRMYNCEPIFMFFQRTLLLRLTKILFNLMYCLTLIIDLYFHPCNRQLGNQHYFLQILFPIETSFLLYLLHQNIIVVLDLYFCRNVVNIRLNSGLLTLIF